MDGYGNVQKLGAVEQLWVAQLANFRYTIIYCPNTQNRNADALSRLQEQRKEVVHAGQVMAEGDETWDERQARDPDLTQIRQWKEQQLPRLEVCDSSSPYMKQLLREWNKILLQNSMLGILVTEAGSDIEASQVILVFLGRRQMVCGDTTTMGWAIPAVKGL